MIAILLKAFTLGLTAAASPGPFQAFLLAESVQKGFKKSFPLAFAPLLSDGPIILILSLALSRAPERFLNLLQLSGAVFILYLAYDAFKNVKNLNALKQRPTTAYPGILKATVTNFLNPNPWIFWGVIGVPLLVQAWGQNISLAVSFLIGFYLTMLSLLLVLIFLFARSAKLGPFFSKGLLGFSVMALLGFGGFQMLTAITGLLAK